MCIPAVQLKNIAPEFYTTLKYHTSWIYVIWAFLTDSDVGPWTRMKRKTPVGTPADAPVMATGVPCPSASYLPVIPCATTGFDAVITSSVASSQMSHALPATCAAAVKPARMFALGQAATPHRLQGLRPLLTLLCASAQRRRRPQAKTRC